jgi:hypothetical protein
MRLTLLLLFICLSTLLHSDTITELFRSEQQNISRLFPSIEKEITALPTYLPQEQKHVQFTIANFFEKQVIPHLQQEMKSILTVIELETKNITDCAIYENKLLMQWISNLLNLTNSEKMDIPAFTMQSLQLLGAIKLHFETVEAVLLHV